MTQETRIAVFRPDDERLAEAVELLEALGADPIADPMLAVEPTGASPRADGDYTILTSKTGVELARAEGWTPSGTVCAIGDRTARALREAGYDVDLIPEEFSSVGLVRALDGEVAGARVEVARSDHGSPVLTEGLNDAGAFVHETVLYRLVRPPESGVSVERAAAGELEGALFTSSLTVEHFLAATDERDLREEAIAGLSTAVVGAIGEPTRATAEREGIAVDAVPENADFEELACGVVERAAPSYRE
ncbi:uroporphyrinogen-III synthase [Halalkalicoccus sp. NIPERK01]|uniref:uroporphyrinogen-III synthase n=1 Tax=Halalkalicoccus sp. NIPERK01 TaxID=3053469 RepID=UPI00256F0B7C|nr:uroporphyrinogen-III synthase [Halalkalicoccus sp. NIPERK01]MDL5362962.1 uroporphyrinogen-III synthase [Halalkalicoccus sp. NIPERK01]